MKRNVTASIDGITITAKIDTAKFGGLLLRGEVERLRDELADRIALALTGLIYLNTPRHRVKVK